MQNNILVEVDIEELADVCYAGGSTHVMKTCSIGGDKYYLKFSDEDMFDEGDPSLQILVEYLAYGIYSLYAGIKIPGFKLVFDKLGKKVGLATTPAKGAPALGQGVDFKILGKMMSQGVFVDVFLSNWDVVGTGTGNVFFDPAAGATRIDPGGSLTFRAQGGRKNAAFSREPKELQTMLKPGSGAGNVFQYSDLSVAASEFKSVPWSRIDQKINEISMEVSGELDSRGMNDLTYQWEADVNEIREKLESRHRDILGHIKFVESNKSVSESVTNSRLIKKFQKLVLS